MGLNVSVYENFVVAMLVGEIDHHSAEHIRSNIDKIMDENRITNLILDMTGVEFMDSSGIGIALGRYNRLSKKGGKVVLIGESEYIYKILNMSGVYKVIRHASSKKEAVRLIAKEEEKDE